MSSGQKKSEKKINWLRDTIHERLSLIYGILGFFSDNKFNNFLFSFLNPGSLEIKTFSGNFVSIACHIVISYNVYVGSVSYDAYRTIVSCASHLGYKIKKVVIYIDMIEL